MDVLRRQPLFPVVGPLDHDRSLLVSRLVHARHQRVAIGADGKHRHRMKVGAIPATHIVGRSITPIRCHTDILLNRARYAAASCNQRLGLPVDVADDRPVVVLVDLRLPWRPAVQIVEIVDLELAQARVFARSHGVRWDERRCALGASYARGTSEQRQL